MGVHKGEEAVLFLPARLRSWFLNSFLLLETEGGFVVLTPVNGRRYKERRLYQALTL